MEGRAHHRELQELGGVAFNVRTHVQHGGDAPQGRPARYRRRTLQPAGHAQQQLGNGHQGAGVAARDGGGGLSLLHRLHAVPQAGAFAAAKRLGRLLLAGDHPIGVPHLGHGARGRVAGEFGLDARLVAMQQEEDLVPLQAFQGVGDAGHGNGDLLVAAHSVDRDHKRAGHERGELSAAGRPEARGR